MPLLFPALLLGCAPPSAAPADLNTAAAALFSSFDDAEALPAALEDLRETLPAEGVSMAPLDAETTSGVSPPSERAVADAVGVGAPYTSPRSPADHTRHMMLADGEPVCPGAEACVRTFTEGADCFASGACDLLRTEEVLTTGSPFLDVTFVLQKEHRWVGDAIVSRAWLEEAMIGDSGHHFWQSYEVAAWMPSDSGATQFMAIWSEHELSDQEFFPTIALNDLEAMLESQSAWLDEN